MPEQLRSRIRRPAQPQTNALGLRVESRPLEISSAPFDTTYDSVLIGKHNFLSWKWGRKQ